MWPGLDQASAKLLGTAHIISGQKSFFCTGSNLPHDRYGSYGVSTVASLNK